MQLSELDWDYVQERAAHFTGRDWVFARLDQFLHQPPGVFLLLGEPGTGKTAIAAQLALAADGRLTPATAVAAPHWAVPIAAAYFCRAGSVEWFTAMFWLTRAMIPAKAGDDDEVPPTPRKPWSRLHGPPVTSDSQMM